MTCTERVSQWTAIVSRQLPHLSRPQASVLALWSLGMVLAQSCGLSQVSALLALFLGQAEVNRPAPQLDRLPAQHIARQTAGRGTKRPRGRELSCVTRGRLCLLASVWLGEMWPQGGLWPEEWPQATQQKRQKQRERQRVKQRKRKAARHASKRKANQLA